MNNIEQLIEEFKRLNFVHVNNLPDKDNWETCEFISQCLENLQAYNTKIEAVKRQLEAYIDRYHNYNKQDTLSGMELIKIIKGIQDILKKWFAK